MASPPPRWFRFAALLGAVALGGCSGIDARPPAPVERDYDRAPFSKAIAPEETDRDPDAEPDEDEGDSWPNIHEPGPDMANFPNSAFTIPRGTFQFEFAPATFNGPSDDSGPIYSTQFLLRYGLTDRLELRLFGLGYTAILSGPQRTTGFSPLAFDAKLNLWDESPDHLIPAVGLEVYIQTEFGSPVYRSGTQPSISLLFDHTLPFDVNFEWNIGLNGAQGQVNDGNDLNGPINVVHNQPEINGMEFNLQWALQKRFFRTLDVFTHGYLNSSAIPGVTDGVVVGGGGIWTFANRRTALFGSYNAGLNRDAPTTFFQLGFANAF